MPIPLRHSVPAEHAAGVARALRETFNVTEPEEVRTIKALPSSLVFRIVVRGTPYLLKISTRTSDPARHYACMAAAADAGLAPRVRYASAEDRISITDFIHAVPLPPAEALVHLPAALHRLHSLPPFPEAPHRINTSCTFLLNQGPALDEFIRRFQSANILSRAESEELFAISAQLAAAWPHHASDMVSSHNDLFKPDNILFDGDRIWFIDWEAAFRNDRYADLAVVAHLYADHEPDETVFLQRYFGKAPDEYQSARLFLMQQTAHAFYAMAFLFLGSPGKPIDRAEPVPEFRDLRLRMRAGEVDFADGQTKIASGRSHLQQLFSNIRQPRFTQALEIVSDRRARC